MSTNNDISSLEVKITAEVANNNMTAIQDTIVVRTTAVRQTESTGGTEGFDTSSQGMNGVNACNASTYSVTVSMYLTRQ